MPIENYSGDIDDLHTRLISDYILGNQRPMDRWEWSHYMEAVQDSVESGNCWECNDSVIVVNNNEIIYASWQGEPMEDFALLFFVLNRYNNVRIVPLGTDLMDMAFIMNAASLKKFVRKCGRSISTDFNRFPIMQVLGYLNE